MPLSACISRARRSRCSRLFGRRGLKFEPGEDFKLYPGKRFKMKKGLTPDERKTALLWHDVVDVTQGWENVIAMSERFSDDDTGISKYTQGNDADHLNKTATGISMIMNAGSLPMKEVIQNIDEMWIERIVEALIDWNMQHLDPETVRVLLGDQHAQRWAEIQQFGKTSFMAWKATGSATFMTKEILMQNCKGSSNCAWPPRSPPTRWTCASCSSRYGRPARWARNRPSGRRNAQATPGAAGRPDPAAMQDALAKQEKLIQNWRPSSRTAPSKQALEAARLAIQDRDSRVNAEAKLAGVELTEAQRDQIQAQVLTLVQNALGQVSPQLAQAPARSRIPAPTRRQPSRPSRSRNRPPWPRRSPPRRSLTRPPHPPTRCRHDGRPASGAPGPHRPGAKRAQRLAGRVGTAGP
jgi:hypothetical protein